MSDYELGFEGRVAIVTGAGAGLGRTYAIDLARRGAKVVVNDLGGARDGSGKGSSTPADIVVEEIKAAGGEAVANYDNVATVEGGENITKTAMDAFGKVDIVVNNAGILRDKSFLKMDPENWDIVVAVHLRGPYCVTRPAFKVMRENGYGRIVLTTSASGIYGNFGQTNYAAAKTAMLGLMNVLGLEGAKYNIMTNTIAPSAASRLTADVVPPEMLERMKPEFVTPIVTYMCSEQCQSSGAIYNAGLGIFSKAQLMTSAPVLVGDGANPPSAEDILKKIDQINNMDNARYYANSPEFSMDFMPKQ
jgi:NAD(P)-dependent dehydrogenase (short-subunit alcohol dehydrogenase family)